MLLNLSNPEADLDIYLQVLREADPAEDGQAVHHLLPDLDLGLLHRQDLTQPFISYFFSAMFRAHPVSDPCLPQYQDSDQSEELEISTQCEISH